MEKKQNHAASAGLPGGAEDSAGKTVTPSADRDLAGFARLTSGLLHDFRTPLGSIVGAASTLDDYADHIDPATRTSLCNGIVEQARRLDHLLTGLAAIARARTGSLTGEESRVEFNEVLRGLSAKAGERHGCAVAISLQPGEIFLTADPLVLQTLVFTMLAMACGLSQDSGGVELSLSGTEEVAELQMVSIVHTESRMRAARLLRNADLAAAGDGAEADTVFLAAIGEVVHSLGGEFLIRNFDTETRLRQTVRLPIDPARARRLRQKT